MTLLVLLLVLVTAIALVALVAEIRRDGLGRREPPRSHEPDVFEARATMPVR